MHAVIVTGGQQFRVAPGQKLKIESLPGVAGEKVVFDKVLMVSEDGANVEIGAPYLKRQVVGTIVEHGRHKKIKVLKNFKRRKHSRTEIGHRQNYTEVEINSIEEAK